MRYKVLENMILVATKHKNNVEKALSAFMDISTNEVLLPITKLQIHLLCSYLPIADQGALSRSVSACANTYRCMFSIKKDTTFSISKSIKINK